MLIEAGEFAENKDIAKSLRIKKIMPALADGNDVIFDFAGVSGATQSFIHALVSEPIREFTDIVFDKLVFENCNKNIRAVLEIVYEYMQEALDG
jgi:hypothetical protein